MAHQLLLATFFSKQLFLNYHKNRLDINFGLIGLKQFQFQQDFWGHRYIYHSYQDRYGFGWPTDYGLDLTYKLNAFISVDGAVTNGSGFQYIMQDNNYKKSVGITIEPIDHVVLRAYYDRRGTKLAQTNMALFAGYRTEKFSAGAEYLLQGNNDYREDYDRGGVSVYTSINVTEKIGVFGRWDQLTSTKIPDPATSLESPWNQNADGKLLLAGVEYKLNSNAKLAFEFQKWAYDSSILDSRARIGLHVEYVF